jgi:superoxide dismutase, Cu-Zn family
MMRRSWIGVTAAAVLLLCFGPSAHAGDNGAGNVKGVAVLHPTEGNTARGVVTFTPRDGEVAVRVEMTGLEPGKRGFHVHEFGDCSAPDATSAGGHYDPTGMPHGAPGDEKRHVGDLGNVTADDDGVVSEEIVDPVISLQGPRSIIGRSVVVHAEEDDFVTQPTGDAGPRVACGVIGIAGP